MSQTELIKYLIENNNEVPVVQIVLGMLFALLLSLCVYQIYKKTYSGVMYSKDFNTTIIMIALITTLVIMIIGSNLALSLGLVGALSIIRFRTAVKDAKDAAFLFWAIGIGLACGTGIYMIGLIGSFLIGLTLLVLHRIRCFEEQAYLLIVRADTLDIPAIETLLGKETRRFRLRMTDQAPDRMEVTYEIALRSSSASVLSCLKELCPEGDIHLISYQGELAGE